MRVLTVTAVEPEREAVALAVAAAADAGGQARPRPDRSAPAPGAGGPPARSRGLAATPGETDGRGAAVQGGDSVAGPNPPEHQSPDDGGTSSPPERTLSASRNHDGRPSAPTGAETGPAQSAGLSAGAGEVGRGASAQDGDGVAGGDLADHEPASEAGGTSSPPEHANAAPGHDDGRSPAAVGEEPTTTPVGAADSGAQDGPGPGRDGGARQEVQVVGLPGGYDVHRVHHAPCTRDRGAEGVTVDVVVGGVGPAAAAAGAATALTAAVLAGQPYDLVVSAGIGGGFLAPQEAPGGAVVASEIVAADLGAQTAEGFASVADLGFGGIVHRAPEALVRAVAGAVGAATGPVLTVSTVTGTAERAAELTARHPGAVAEAMEGFGVAEAAAAHDVPVLELRTVSNAVGPRDRAAWRIPDALDALTRAYGRMIAVLDGWEVDGG